jgi:hypothetical protein
MTIQVFKIPLNNFSQKFNLTLSGKALTFITRWNQYMPAWELGFQEQSTQTPIYTFVPLVTGTDLISQYSYNKILPGVLLCFTDGIEDDIPTENNLGVESNLYYITDTSNG